MKKMVIRKDVTFSYGGTNRNIRQAEKASGHTPEGGSTPSHSEPIKKPNLFGKKKLLSLTPRGRGQRDIRTSRREKLPQMET